MSDPEQENHRKWVRVRIRRRSGKTHGWDFLRKERLYRHYRIRNENRRKTIKSHSANVRLVMAQFGTHRTANTKLFKDLSARLESAPHARFLPYGQPICARDLNRVLGEVTEAGKLEIVRESDAIYAEEIAKNGLERRRMAILLSFRWASAASG